MPDWIEVLFRLLSQFTGIQGGVDNIIVVYGIAAIFYAILFSFAKSNYQDTASFRDRLLQWGFGFGLARELFMLVMAVILAEGLVEPGILHQLFPPVEHEFLDLAFVTIASAYIGYFTNNNVLALRYLKAGMTVTALAYLATFWWWFIYIRANPTHHFADVWCDPLFHANGTFWLLLAAYLIYKNARPDTTRSFVLAALCFMALSTFLKIPDIVLHEVYIAVIAPTARTLYLSAILMLGYAYISEQIQKRKFAEAQILEQASTMQLLMNHSPAALAMFDRQMCYLAYSQRWIADYSLGDQDIIGRSLYDVFPGIPENWKLLHRRALEGEVLHADDAFVRLDGTIQRLKLEIRPWSANNQIGGIIIFSEDITERYQAEQELHNFSAKLERSNRELQDFATVASHDLQEPLRKIQTFGDRLQLKHAAALNEEGREYLERMQDAAQRMRALIDDLLTFSRVTAKAQPFEPVNLNEVVRDVLSLLEPGIMQSGGITQSGAQIEVAELITLDAEPGQMRQLLQNLISNALKFHRPTEAPKIKISGQRLEASGGLSNRAQTAAWYQLEVADQGIGFDEKYLDRIFTIFQRLHGRDEYPGSGIGLAICRKIAEHHGGQITARSKPGAGATFIVTLPLRQLTEATATQRRTAP